MVSRGDTDAAEDGSDRAGSAVRDARASGGSGGHALARAARVGLGALVLAAGMALSLELGCGVAYLAGLYGALGSGVLPALLACWAVLASVTLVPALWAAWPLVRRAAAQRAARAAGALGVAVAVALALFSNAVARPAPTGASPGVLDETRLRAALSGLVALGPALPPPAARLGALISDEPVECARPPEAAPVSIVAAYFARSNGGVALRCAQGADLAGALAELRAELETKAVRGPIALDVLSLVQRLPARHAWLDAFKLRPGLDGVCHAGRCVLPWQLLAAGAFSTYRPLAFIPDLQFGIAPEQLRERVGAPRAAGVAGLTRLETRAYALDLGASRPVLTPLVRMRRSEVPLTRPVLERAERDAEGYVLAALRPDGRFRYTLEPFTGAADDVSFNLARQAGTALVLCELGRPTRRGRAAAERAVAAFLPFLRTGTAVSALASDAGASFARIGENALPLASMLSCDALGRARLSPAAPGLARLILSLQRDDGGFAPALELRDGRRLDGAEPLYAAGQAVLALVLLEQRQTSRPSSTLPAREELHAAVERAMEHFATAYWSHPLRDFFFLEENWHCLAARAALGVHRHSGYEQFCIDYVRFKSRLILQREEGVDADFDGGFGFGNLIPPHNTGAAGFGEALAAALPVLEARGAPTSSERALLERVMRFLLRQQWSRENCAFCATPEVVGGMSEHTHSSLTRIDFAQHAWAALGHGRRALGAPLAR